MKLFLIDHSLFKFILPAAAQSSASAKLQLAAASASAHICAAAPLALSFGTLAF
jgi:hypothetical protein